MGGRKNPAPLFCTVKIGKRLAARAAKSLENPASVIAGGNHHTSSVRAASRLWLFRLFASVVVPLMLLGVLEVTLRVVGFGHRTTFFVPRDIQGRRVLVENPLFGLSFFPPALMRSATPLVMKTEKRPGTCRIFLFGESAAMGDPRPAYSVGRYLEVLLRERFPQTEFEVVCVAMTAINSHAIVSMARECARYHGDLWIIYMGNNELLGPFGASTVFGPQAPAAALVRIHLALQRTRLGQALVALARKIHGGETPSSWGGLKMFLDQQLPPIDQRKERVYQNFQANLTSIVRAGIASGVPIILSSVESNLRDCPPFGSLPPQDLAGMDLAQWNALLWNGVTNQAREQFGAALANYQQAARIASQSPELQFRLGECFLQATNIAEARRHFALARDLDALPFRADSRINRIIAETASHYADRGVFFLNAEQALAARAPNGITGEESFYEHVHLNFEGNYALARALAERAAGCLPSGQVAGGRPAWADEATCAQRLALTDWNRLAVLEEIKSRMANAPFSNQAGHEARLERLEQQVREIQARRRSSSPQEIRAIYEEALQRRPHDHWLHHNFAEYLTRVGELAQATREMEEVCRLVPHHYSGYFHKGRLQAQQKRYAEACQSLETALRLRPEFIDIYLELGRASTGRGDPQGGLKYCDLAQQRHFDDGRVHLLKAKILEGLKRREEAVRSLREAIRIQPALWEAHDMLGAELALEGDFAAAQVEFEEVVRLQPAYSEGHMNLGIALARQRHFADALAQFHDTLRLDPRNRKAQEFLSAIEELQKREP
jgi:tetratricopeptide (TPR) repeat protein